jgi:hypothetical protein
VVPVEPRMMVFHCTTLIRELDPGVHRSTIIGRWFPTPVPRTECKGCVPGQCVKHVMGLDTKNALGWGIRLGEFVEAMDDG